MRLVLALAGASFLSTRTTVRLERAAGRQRARAASPGEAAAHKAAYFGRVTVGGEPFTLLFDTGSGNLIVPSTQCGDEACQKHKRYAESGRALQADGSDFAGGHRDEMTVTFGTGEMGGVFVADQVCLGSICVDQKLVSARHEDSEPFATFAFDGVLGLGLPSMSQGPGFNFLQNLPGAQGHVRPVVGCFLSDQDGASEMTFGGPDKSKVRGELQYAQVLGDGYWQVYVMDLAVNGQKLGLGPFRGVLDTGTSNLGVPSDKVDALNAKLPVPADCKGLESLPGLGFVVSTTGAADGAEILLEVPSSEYVVQVPAAALQDAPSLLQDDSVVCGLGVLPLDPPPSSSTDDLEALGAAEAKAQGIDVSVAAAPAPAPELPLVLLGEPLLRTYYTVYDAGQKRVGFAPSR